MVMKNDECVQEYWVTNSIQKERGSKGKGL